VGLQASSPTDRIGGQNQKKRTWAWQKRNPYKKKDPKKLRRKLDPLNPDKQEVEALSHCKGPVSNQKEEVQGCVPRRREREEKARGAGAEKHVAVKKNRKRKKVSKKGEERPGRKE